VPKKGATGLIPGRLKRREFCLLFPCAAINALPLAGGWKTFSLGCGGVADMKTGDFNKEMAMDGKLRGVKEVKAKVISVKGVCGLHKVGDVAKFTQTGVEGKICIHAMYSMLPKAFAMMFNAQFPWAQNADVLTHACPDAANPVVFELTRVYED
jgi:uncharacterized repeat protein (TIGR04076 family)